MLHELLHSAAAAVLSFVILSALAIFLKAERATWSSKHWPLPPDL